MISANSGDVRQNSLAEHIMQKFIEVFDVVCCYPLVLKLFMLFFQWKPCIGCPIFPRFSSALCFHALLIGGGRVCVFPRKLLRACSCLFPAFSTGDIFPSFPGPVPSTCFMFSCAFYRFHISFPRSLSIIRYFLKYVLIYVTFVTVFLTGIVFLFSY